LQGWKGARKKVSKVARMEGCKNGRMGGARLGDCKGKFLNNKGGLYGFIKQE
jgi:hypothetical protein